MITRVGMFARILLWFIATVLIVTGVTAAMIWYLHEHASDDQHRQDVEILFRESRDILTAVERGDISSATSMFPIWIADHSGKLIWKPSFPEMPRGKHPRGSVASFPSPLSPGRSSDEPSDRPPRGPSMQEIQQFIASAAIEFFTASETPRLFETGDEEFLAGLVISPGGLPYVSFLKYRPSPFKIVKRIIWSPDLISRLFVLVCVAVVLCWLLARSLAGPVLELRRKSRSIADGEFQTRLPPNLTGRTDELGELAQDFNRMAETIEETFKGQRQLLRDVSHELRSPLARIHVALELIRKKDPSDLDMLAGKIERDLERLNELIQQILDFSRMDQMQVLPVALVPVDMAGFLRNIAADVSFEAGLHGKTIRSVAPKNPLSIPIASELMRRAVENILRNAVRHAPDQSEVLMCLEPCETENRVQISIRDHGPGVAEEHLSRLFIPFFRCEEDRGRQSGGNGLGLAIVKRAVEIHGGTVMARNAEGGGLEVIIQLPIPG
ncbi:MAG TPA: ATP-binding protein [Candidatus Ozemobacteraceae bacterium]|nr:ATP-binding protein [Candidatus Ozemobacteraceae bacterium]